MSAMTHNTPSDTPVNSDITPEEDTLRHQFHGVQTDNITLKSQSSSLSDDSTRNHWFSPRPYVAIIVLLAISHRITTETTASHIELSISSIRGDNSTRHLMYATLVYTSAHDALAMLGGVAADALVDNFCLLTACGVGHSCSLVLLLIGVCYVHNEALFWIGLVLQGITAAIFEPTAFVFAAHQCRLRSRRQISAISILYYWCMKVCRIVGLIIAGERPQLKLLLWIGVGLSVTTTALFALFRHYYKRRLPNQVQFLDFWRWLFRRGAVNITESAANTLRQNIVISLPFIGVLACCWTPIFLVRYSLAKIALPHGMGTTDFCVLTMLFTPFLWLLIRNGLALCPFRRTFFGILCSFMSSLVGAAGSLIYKSSESPPMYKILLAVVPNQLLLSVSEPLINVAALEISWTFSTKEVKTMLYGFLTMSVAINGLMTAMLMWLLDLHHKFQGTDASHLYLGCAGFQMCILIFYCAYYRATTSVRTP